MSRTNSWNINFWPNLGQIPAPHANNQLDNHMCEYMYIHADKLHYIVYCIYIYTRLNRPKIWRWVKLSKPHLWISHLICLADKATGFGEAHQILPSRNSFNHSWNSNAYLGPGQKTTSDWKNFGIKRNEKHNYAVSASHSWSGCSVSDQEETALLALKICNHLPLPSVAALAPQLWPKSFLWRGTFPKKGHS